MAKAADENNADEPHTPAGGVVKHVVLRTSLAPAVNLRRAVHKLLRASIGTAALFRVSDWIHAWRHPLRRGRKRRWDYSAIKNFIDNYRRRNGGIRRGNLKPAKEAANSKLGVSFGTIETALRPTKSALKRTKKERMRSDD